MGLDGSVRNDGVRVNIAHPEVYPRATDSVVHLDHSIALEVGALRNIDPVDMAYRMGQMPYTLRVTSAAVERTACRRRTYLAVFAGDQVGWKQMTSLMRVGQRERMGDFDSGHDMDDTVDLVVGKGDEISGDYCKADS